MSKDKIKVLPVKRFNLVHLIFIILLIYMIVVLGKYLSKEEVKVTEISEGTLTQNHNYTGLILRDEKIIKSKMNGYLTCFTNDNERVAKGRIMFVVDRTGKALKASTNYKKKLTEAQLKSLRKSLNYFSTAYQGQSFSQVYNFKNQLSSMIFDIEQTSAKKLRSNKKLYVKRSNSTGLVFFSFDGMENMKEEDITRAFLKDFEDRNSRLVTGDYVEEGQAICKLIRSEEWQVIIPITDEDVEYYNGEKYATVRFNDTDKTCTAGIEIFKDVDGRNLARLTMKSFMAAYARERLVAIQLVKKLSKGLKIPKSSVISRELYTIPVEYAKEEMGNDTVSFWRLTDEEPDTISVTYSNRDDYFYYVADSQISKNTVLCMEDADGKLLSNAIYKIEEKKNVKGVYNVNKGYALFKAVDIVDENDSYCIVEGVTDDGLQVYDHIVLNAASVKEDDLLY